MNRFMMAVAISGLLLLVGCKKESPSAAEQGATAPPAKTDAAQPAPQPAATSEKDSAAGHAVEIIELGTTKIGELMVRATRDTGEVKPGGDAPIDVWVTTADGQPATVKAVRFWIGSEDAKHSIKAKAEIEIPAETNHWHTHALVPSPLPEGSMLWVEIESTESVKATGSFDLKT